MVHYWRHLVKMYTTLSPVHIQTIIVNGFTGCTAKAERADSDRFHSQLCRNLRNVLDLISPDSALHHCTLCEYTFIVRWMPN